MRYDRQTQDLLKDIAALRDANDRRILSAVARLKKTATALNDNYLLGFTYYHSAYGKYYFRKNYGGFTDDLVRAAKYLVFTDDHEIIARVYNFVAVDAHMRGCYNIAYNFYMNALEHNRLASGNAHTLRLLNELKIDCYRETGDKKRLLESLSEQPAMLDAQHAMFAEVFTYTKELVRIDNDLRNAQLSVRAENRELQIRAYHDALTGIANRYMLTKMLVASFERAKESGAMLGITVLDIDNLKSYNDTYGHGAGDTCIITVASEISRLAASAGNASASVFCGRYGGDEFILIYEGMREQQIARHAREISEAVSNLKLKHENSTLTGYVSVSQGLYMAVPDRRARLWDFLLAADKALYSIKRAPEAKRRKTMGIAFAAPQKPVSGESGTDSRHDYEEPL